VSIGRCGLLILAWGTWFGCSLPSDASLESAFAAKREHLEALIRLLQEDHLTTLRISSGRVLTDDNRLTAIADHLSPERQRRYRDLLEKLGLEGVRWLEQDGTKVFCVFRVEWWVYVEKGYAYRETPPKRLFESLDRHPKERIAEGEPIYKRLEGNWYIYYMYFT
jgi:hypothetical protein